MIEFANKIFFQNRLPLLYTGFYCIMNRWVPVLKKVPVLSTVLLTSREIITVEDVGSYGVHLCCKKKRSRLLPVRSVRKLQFTTVLLLCIIFVLVPLLALY
jgi:hypothetical protein